MVEHTEKQNQKRNQPFLRLCEILEVDITGQKPLAAIQAALPEDTIFVKIDVRDETTRQFTVWEGKEN